MNVLQEERMRTTPLVCKNISIDPAPLSAPGGGECSLFQSGWLAGTSQQVNSRHESNVHARFTPDFIPSYQQPI